MAFNPWRLRGNAGDPYPILRTWWTAQSLFVPVLELRKDERTETEEKTSFVLLSFENTVKIIVLAFRAPDTARCGARWCTMNPMEPSN